MKIYVQKDLGVVLKSNIDCWFRSLINTNINPPILNKRLLTMIQATHEIPACSKFKKKVSW